MSTKKFIGGGFPGIRPCIDSKDVITKESREKREFSVRKIVSIGQLLAKKTNKIDTEELSIKDHINYDIINNKQYVHSDTHFDLNLINAPIPKRIIKSKHSKKSKKSIK